MPAHESCACCHARVTPVRPSFAARASFYALLAGFLGLIFAYPLLGFLWPFVIPILVIAGMGIGPIVDAAFAPPLCPSCHRRFVSSSEGREGAPVEALPAPTLTTTR